MSSMRNILVFPDGSQHPFMYPMNRDINEGDKLKVVLQDDSIEVMTIQKIEQKGKDIYYYLSF